LASYKTRTRTKEKAAMKAEIEMIVDEIRGSLQSLRRHL